MIRDVEIRQATEKDIRKYYPRGSPRTVYAWVALYKGESACLAGVILERGAATAFSDMAPDIDAPKATIWKTAKALLEHIKSVGLPMIAATEPCSRRSVKFLERLGFEFSGNCQGMEIYKWRH